MIYIPAPKTWISANITQAWKYLVLYNIEQPKKTYICKKTPFLAHITIYHFYSFQTLQKQIIKERFKNQYNQFFS